MEHFNTRNASVVPELSELGDCNVQFDMDKSNIINADGITPIGLEALAAETQPPCSVVGPFDDVSTTCQLSIFRQRRKPTSSP